MFTYNNQQFPHVVSLLIDQELKLPVVGSQIVGLIPLKAMLDSADFYIQRDGLFIVEEEHKVRLVGMKLFKLKSLMCVNMYIVDDMK